MQCDINLFVDDTGIYYIGPLGVKVHCKQVAPGIYSTISNNGNLFAAEASAITAALQTSGSPEYWKHKKAIIGGKMYDHHLPMDVVTNSPVKVLSTLVANCNDLKTKLGVWYTAWVKDGVIWVKHKSSGEKHSFNSFDDALQHQWN